MFFNHKQWMFTSLILCNAVYVNASNFNGSVIFGDSLSDGGNVGLATLGQATKFTTNPGMTTAEIVADRIGHHTTASLLGGQNYAWGGATVSDLEKRYRIYNNNSDNIYQAMEDRRMKIPCIKSGEGVMIFLIWFHNFKQVL